MQQSAATYQTIKRTLESPQAPYAGRSYQVFLQGSYGNDTNIHADSDVDIVIWTDEVFYYDLAFLNSGERSGFESTYTRPGSYSYNKFKQEVVQWLSSQYGTDVRVGSKAASIKGNGGRRDADVLVAADFRTYWQFTNKSDQSYARGIVFWKSDGTKIVNYPKQHMDNCTRRHQNTGGRFKPMVRVLKNMRNKTLEAGHVVDGVAPSYYLEGLLSNAPDSPFRSSLQETLEHSMGYLGAATARDLLCANRIHYLVRDNSEVNWPSANFATYMRSVEDFWRRQG